MNDVDRKHRGRVPSRIMAAGLHGSALLCLLAGSAARADLTVVSRVTLTMGGRGVPAQELVTYFKGDRLRSETGSIATIFDTDAGRVIRVDRSRKTYMVLSQKQASKAAGALGGLKFETSARVKPGGKTRIVAGRPARNYLTDASLQVRLPGFPGEPPATRMQIEQWTTNTVPVPAATRRVLALASTGISGSLTAGMKPLTEALSRVPGLPLSTRVTMQSTRPGVPGGSVTSLTEVRSIRTGVLKDDLFRVPRGYRKVDPPRVERYARRFQSPAPSAHRP